MSTIASEVDPVIRSYIVFGKVNRSEQNKEVKERRAEFTKANEHWSN
ncbi:hypothetical protein UT300018_34110 [Clostridium faecium]